MSEFAEDYHDHSDSDESIVSRDEEDDYFQQQLAQRPGQGDNWAELGLLDSE